MLRARTLIPGCALAAVALGSAVIAASGGASAASLTRGWNNISYLGDAKAPAEALSPISGEYSSVYRWDPATQTYLLYAPGAPAFANTLTTVSPGDAIWVSSGENSRHQCDQVRPSGSRCRAGPQPRTVHWSSSATPVRTNTTVVTIGNRRGRMRSR